MKKVVLVLLCVFIFIVACVVKHNTKGAEHPDWAKEIGSAVESTCRFISKSFGKIF